MERTFTKAKFETAKGPLKETAQEWLDEEIIKDQTVSKRIDQATTIRELALIARDDLTWDLVSFLDHLARFDLPYTNIPESGWST